MNNIIEIQQEFENLISELETLRTVNQMTSSNESSARMVIEKIDRIIAEISELHKLVNQDFRNKSEALSKILKEIPGKIKENLGQTSNEIIKIHTTEINRNRGIMNPINEDLKQRTEQLKNNVTELQKIKTDIAGYLSKIDALNFSAKLDNIEQGNKNNKDSIDEVNIQILDVVNKLTEEIKALIQENTASTQAEIEKLNKLILRQGSKQLKLTIFTWIIFIIIAGILFYFM